jgi:hypothetical protein
MVKRLRLGARPRFPLIAGRSIDLISFAIACANAPFHLELKRMVLRELFGFLLWRAHLTKYLSAS